MRPDPTAKRPPWVLSSVTTKEPPMSQFRQNADLSMPPTRRERVLGVLLAIAIGTALAAGLVYGWSV